MQGDADGDDHKSPWASDCPGFLQSFRSFHFSHLQCKLKRRIASIVR
jgi:hypothetical protein